MTCYTLAVLSDSPDYIHRFLAYCRDHNTIFKVSGFTDLKALEEYVQVCSVDMLLLSRNLYEKGNISNDSDDRNKIGEIVCMGEQQDLSSSPKELNIYQPMNRLLDTLADIASSLNIKRRDADIKADIIGIYVLDGELSVNDFIRALASERGRRVLHVDLDSFSGIPLMQGFTANSSLSDLIYYFRTEHTNLTEHVRDCCILSDGIYYLAPPVSPADITLISGSQLETFFESLAESGNYDIVIINIPGIYPDLVELLGICRKVYLFSKEFAAISASGSDKLTGSLRTQAFCGYFRDHDRLDILSKCENGYAKAASLPTAASPSSAPGRKFKSNGKKRADRAT